MILHEIYFDGLGGGAKPAGALAEAIARDFGSVERWRTEFAAMGKAEGGGSGCGDPRLLIRRADKRLVNNGRADHTTTLAGGRPVLVLDMYEHAYHSGLRRGCRALTSTCIWKRSAGTTQRRFMSATAAKARLAAPRKQHFP